MRRGCFGFEDAGLEPPSMAMRPCSSPGTRTPVVVSAESIQVHIFDVVLPVIVVVVYTTRSTFVLHACLPAGRYATAHLFIVNPLSGGGLQKLFSTHPPMAERVARLTAMAAVKPPMVSATG